MHCPEHVLVDCVVVVKAAPAMGCGVHVQFKNARDQRTRSTPHTKEAAHKIKGRSLHETLIKPAVSTVAVPRHCEHTGGTWGRFPKGMSTYAVAASPCPVLAAPQDPCAEVGAPTKRDDLARALVP